MKRYLIFLLPLFFLWSCNQQTKKKEAATPKTVFDGVYREIQEIPYFEGYQTEVGCVIDIEGRLSKYAFESIVKGDQRIVLLEKIINPKEAQKKYQILDTVHINGFEKDDFLILCDCLKDGRGDSRIFAKTKRIENAYEMQYYSSFHRAWRANLETKKIEEIAVEGIQCTNDTYGI
jgi:hypothetical protein